MKYTLLITCISLLLLATSLGAAERRAMIVLTRTGDAAVLEASRRTVLQARTLLEGAGFNPSNIHLFCDGGESNIAGSVEANTATITRALTALATTARADDELWFFLFGYANVNAKGVSIALSGERLYGKQLADILDQVPGRQHIFCLNQQSAALMPLLSRGGRVVVTATSDPAQLNPPVFPGYLFSAWAATPTNSLLDILRAARQQTTDYFKSAAIAESESPQAFDGTTLIESPFTTGDAGPLGALHLADASPAGRLLAETSTGRVDTATAPAASTPDTEMVSLEAIRKTLEESDPPESPLQPATPETRAQLAAATQAAPAYAAFPAFDLIDHRQLTVGADKAVFETDDTTTYLTQDSAAGTYGVLCLEDSPPDVELTLQAARIIYPDGSYRDVKPRRVRSPLEPLRRHYLRFPGAVAGCLIQCRVEYREAASEALPDFQRDILLQREIPCQSRRLILSTPVSLACRHKLYRSGVTPGVATNGATCVTTFDLGSVPALEPLAFDPPLSETAVRLMLSSTPTWAAFAAWTGRILRDSDKLDATTTALAAQLTRHATNDADKVKALYDFLCELRYETVPVGARAFRPRLPGEVCTSRRGDCKDKANALVAMARAVGVEGRMALVNRLSSTDPDLPGWQFNHAVAWFPHLSGYTNGLWCDATDGSTTFGTLPPGDIGRQALILDPTTPSFATITLAHARKNLYAQTLMLAVTNGGIRGHAILHASGLPDYFLRQTFKQATPLQARQFFQERINRITAGLTAGAPDITPAGDLSKPFGATATVTGAGWNITPRTLPPPIDLWAAAAAPDRDRPLQLNDGQPVEIRQYITVTGVAPVTSSRWSQRTVFFSASVDYSPLSNGWKRVIIVDLTQPTIPAASYAAFRQQVQDFYTALHAEPDLKTKDNALPDEGTKQEPE